MSKSTVVLKNKNRFGGKRCIRSSPIDSVGKIDVEICDHWLPLQLHVRGRREIGLFDILQLANESLLRRATAARIPFDCSLVDHDGKGEPGMGLRFCHDEPRGLIDAVARAIPIDHHAIDAAADHICNLAMNLCGVRRAVAHVHVVRLSKPEQQVSVDLRIRAGIQQRMDVGLTYIASARISIRLGDETVGRAGVVRGLCDERCCRGHVVCVRIHVVGGQKQKCNTQILETHLSSGAEGPRLLLGLAPAPREARPPLNSAEPAS